MKDAEAAKCENASFSVVANLEKCTNSADEETTWRTERRNRLFNKFETFNNTKKQWRKHSSETKIKVLDRETARKRNSTPMQNQNGSKESTSIGLSGACRRLLQSTSQYTGWCIEMYKTERMDINEKSE